MTDKHWYVLHAHSGSEKAAQRALTERIRRANLEELFGKILVPVEDVVEMKMGQKTTTERKFFPGYILIEMVMNDQTWHLVKATPKISGFVGGHAHRPTPLPAADVQKILHQMEEGADRPRPKILFEVGETVRIKEGPFADFVGSVEEVNYDKSRLRVSVVIFGRATPVELEFNQVDKT